MKISVVGAYGYTGRLICNELQEAKLEFAVVGRNLEKLEIMHEDFGNSRSLLCLDLRNLADVHELISASDIVVNCAGPFTEESVLLVQEIARSGKIYLDITGELGFVRDSWKENNRSAIDSGAIIIHGCAFESLLADLALQKLTIEDKDIVRFQTFYWFNNSKVSPGTRMTMKLSKFRESLKIDRGEWAISDIVLDRLKVDVSSEQFDAVPYPLPEVAYAQWNSNAQMASSYLLVSKEVAMFLGHGKAKEKGALETLDRIRVNKASGPSEQERQNQLSRILISVANSKGMDRKVVMESSDMYLLTAVSIRLAVERVIRSARGLSGVISPAALFRGEELEVLEKLHVNYQSNTEEIFTIC